MIVRIAQLTITLYRYRCIGALVLIFLKKCLHSIFKLCYILIPAEKKAGTTFESQAEMNERKIKFEKKACKTQMDVVYYKSC